MTSGQAASGGMTRPDRDEETVVKIVLGTLLVVLVLLQLQLWSGAGGLSEITRLENEIAGQERENATLERRNQTLMQEVSELRNGLDAIEERARSELGLIRKGETFFLIIENEPDRAAAADGPAEPPGIFVASPESQPVISIDIAPEPPPELEEESNPYLEIFRDGEGAASGAEGGRFE